MALATTRRETRRPITSTTTTAGSDTDRQAVLEPLAALYRAWEARDAETFVADYTDDASVIQPGVYKKDREETWECAVRWSVGIEAEAGRVLTREQVVELADAVAASGGVASGIGTSRYGARLIVQADSLDEAVARATDEFTAAAAKVGLPPGPVVRTEAVSEDEDAEDAEP